jgi:hypothetical protein
VVTFHLEYVTPELASYYLSLSHEDNRPLDQHKAWKLELAIRNDEWKLNNHLIAFDPEGRLVDGQHRLHAIVKAGVGVDIGVVRGLEWHD